MSDNMFETLWSDIDEATTSTPSAVTKCNIDEIYTITQDRKTFRDIDGLAATIKENGQETPVVVAPKDERGYRLINGERRYRAIKLLNEQGKAQPILIFVRENVDTTTENGFADGQTRLGQIVDNVQRSDLLPSEIANGINALMSEPYNMPIREIKRKLSKSDSWVSGYRKLSKASNKVLALEEIGIHDRELLVTLVKLEELEPTLLDKFLDRYNDKKSIARRDVYDYYSEQKKIIKNPFNISADYSKKAIANITQAINSVVVERQLNEDDKYALISTTLGVIESQPTPPDNPVFESVAETKAFVASLKMIKPELDVIDEDPTDDDNDEEYEEYDDEEQLSLDMLADSEIKKKPTTRNKKLKDRQNDELLADFNNGVLSIGDFSTPITKDNGYDLLRSLSTWLESQK